MVSDFLRSCGSTNNDAEKFDIRIRICQYKNGIRFNLINEDISMRTFIQSLSVVILFAFYINANAEEFNTYSSSSLIGMSVKFTDQACKQVLHCGTAKIVKVGMDGSVLVVQSGRKIWTNTHWLENL